MAERSREGSTPLRWHPGDVVGHELAQGLCLRVEQVLPDGEHVRALVLRRGETRLSEGHVLTFRTEYLAPLSE